MIDLAVTRLRPDVPLPESAFADDAGLDLSACDPVTLPPGGRAIIGTGLAVEIPPGHAGLVVPRSGLAARHGLSIVNAPGLIDAGYRGEIKVVLLNTDLEHSLAIEPGMRIAQLVIVPVPAVRVVEAIALSGSERGDDGFGSTGP